MNCGKEELKRHLVPVQGDPNDHKKNLSDSIQQVPTKLVLSQQALADLAEEAEHG